MMLPLTSPFDINRQGESRLQDATMKEVVGEDEKDGDFHDNPEDNVLEGGEWDAETATKKLSSSREGKEVGDENLFRDGGPLHSLTRRTVPIWNCSTSAVVSQSTTISGWTGQSLLRRPGISTGSGTKPR